MLAKNKVQQICLMTLILQGCASSVVHLNEPSRSLIAPDLANLLKTRDIPYEIKEIDGVEIGYSLTHYDSDNFPGYRLTLVFRNKTQQAKTITPGISLVDKSKIQIPAYSYETVVGTAAVLAGTQVPPMPIEQRNSYYSTGTIRNVATGNAYSYSSTATQAPMGAAGGFASGFAQGMAQGAAIRAMNDREEGMLMMRWANAYWLKNSYALQPNAGAVGALFFPAPKVGELPLTLTVTVDNSTFQFQTIANTGK